MLGLERPSNRVFKAFRGWFLYKRPFIDCSTTLLDNDADLIALVTTREPERLSRILKYWLGPFIHV